MVSALSGVFRIAEMFFHLDFEAGLEDLLGEISEEPVGAYEIGPVGSRLINELRGQRLVRPLLFVVVERCRHRHIMIGPGGLSFPPSERSAFQARPVTPLI